MKEKTGVQTETQPVETDNDDMFASNELLELQEEQNAGDPTVNEDEDIVIRDDDEEVTLEPETDLEPKEKDKFDGKSVEEIKEAYSNLEKLVGRQGQELGELRKQLQTESKPAEKQAGYTEADIPNMPDADLAQYLSQYEQWLSQPGIQLEEADKYSAYNLQYLKLYNEHQNRQARKQVQTVALTEANENIINTYPHKSLLTADELETAKAFALKSLADNGKITHADLDVALHKKFPDKYAKILSDKERQRIAKAQTSTTPRLPTDGGGTAPKTVTIAQIKAMSDEERDKFYEGLTVDQLEKVRQELNKR